MIPEGIKKSIKEMFEKGYTYRTIHYILEKQHNYSLSFQYLQHKVIPKLGLKRRNIGIDIDRMFDMAVKEIKNGCSGCENLRYMLKLKHHCQIKRELSRDLVRLLDPRGIQRRKARRLRRRQYISRGPNYVWHIDGYDKLKPFGISIHGCIDGFSRKVLWIEAGSTNKRPEVVAHYLMNTVNNLKGFPTKIRADPGTENGIIATIQATFTSNLNSVISGSSVLNQRIERWWGWLRQAKSDFWINHFKCLEAEGILVPNNIIHRTCLQFAYLPIIRKELKEIQLMWNSHRIRRQNKGDTLSGIPDVMYSNPEIIGCKDYILPACQLAIDFFKNLCQTEGELYNEIDIDFATVLKDICHNSQILTEADNIEDAKHLFIYLKEIMEILM